MGVDKFGKLDQAHISPPNVPGPREPTATWPRWARTWLRWFWSSTSRRFWREPSGRVLPRCSNRRRRVPSRRITIWWTRVTAIATMPRSPARRRSSLPPCIMLTAAKRSFACQRGRLATLALSTPVGVANHLMNDYTEARRSTGDGSRSHYARSYARHLALTHPGCQTITLRAVALVSQSRPGRRGTRGRKASRSRRRRILHDARTNRRLRVRRLLTGPAAYLAELAHATARGWNVFFFQPADPTRWASCG